MFALVANKEREHNGPRDNIIIRPKSKHCFSNVLPARGGLAEKVRPCIKQSMVRVDSRTAPFTELSVNLGGAREGKRKHTALNPTLDQTLPTHLEFVHAKKLLS